MQIFYHTLHTFRVQVQSTTQKHDKKHKNFSNNLIQLIQIEVLLNRKVNERLSFIKPKDNKQKNILNKNIARFKTYFGILKTKFGSETPKIENRIKCSRLRFASQLPKFDFAFWFLFFKFCIQYSVSFRFRFRFLRFRFALFLAPFGFACIDRCLSLFEPHTRVPKKS